MIYFLQNGDAIKIGYAANPEARVAQLQCASPHEVRALGVCQGAPGDERALHKRFSADHIRHEWFRLSDTIREFVASNCSAYTLRLDGRRQRNAGRTVQFNIKMTPHLKARITAACKARHTTLVVAAEEAFAAWIGRGVA